MHLAELDRIMIAWTQLWGLQAAMAAELGKAPGKKAAEQENLQWLAFELDQPDQKKKKIGSKLSASASRFDTLERMVRNQAKSSHILMPELLNLLIA